MQMKLWFLAIGAVALVGACGDTALERGASGAVIGAGVGEVVADEPVAGGVIGAGAGVLTE